MLDKEIIRPTIKGLLTLVPGVQKVLPSGGTGGTDSAYYCYGVWLKHLTLLWESGLRSIPHTMAELGPGDSFGIGLSAMLCGVDHYYALDVVRYSNRETNLRIFDQLVTLFESRAARPTKGWPDFDEYLNEDFFPAHILTDELLGMSLSKVRVAAIRKCLESSEHDDEISIKYMVPWQDSCNLRRSSVDLVLSHSVLEHVSDIENTYRALYEWLKPKGIMTHQIDYTSHGLSKKWNGYRAFPEFLWKIVLGRRPFLINRQPHSVHIGFLKNSGFKIICELINCRSDGIPRTGLSNYWKNISDDDLICAGTFIQVEKFGA